MLWCWRALGVVVQTGRRKGGNCQAGAVQSLDWTPQTHTQRAALLATTAFRVGAHAKSSNALHALPPASSLSADDKATKGRGEASRPLHVLASPCRRVTSDAVRRRQSTRREAWPLADAVLVRRRVQARAPP